LTEFKKANANGRINFKTSLTSEYNHYIWYKIPQNTLLTALLSINITAASSYKKLPIPLRFRQPFIINLLDWLILQLVLYAFYVSIFSILHVYLQIIGRWKE